MWRNFVADFQSEGVLLQAFNKVKGNDSKYTQGQPVSTTLAQSGFDLVTSRILPPPLLASVRDLVDPTMRRTNPSPSLDYNPGALEGIKAKIPGLTKTLPPKGKVKTELLENALPEIAALEASGHSNAYKIAVNNAGKAVVSYVNPEEMGKVPRWKTALRFAGANIKPVNREGYARAVAGEETEYKRLLRKLNK